MDIHSISLLFPEVRHHLIPSPPEEKNWEVYYVEDNEIEDGFVGILCFVKKSN